MLRRHFLIGSCVLALGTAGAQQACAAPESATATSPIVRTRFGQVRGSSDNGVYTFKGIPFAAQPFGANHLRPPQTVDIWSGIREALSFGPKAPQQSYPPEVAALVPPELVGIGQDCLTLNIWSNDLGSANMPVMMWIAGGLFEFHGTGASPWYDGSRFAEDGIVLVTINYRVGAEGFLFLNDGLANLGLLDQVAALEWVRDNIAAFGGDPANVTIFGESAGASSVAMLCAMPRAKGLFRRAIVQSGGAQHLSPSPIAERIGRKFAEKLGVAVDRNAIAALPVERIVEAQAALRDELAVKPDPQLYGEIALTSLYWQPVIDGDVLSASPVDLMQKGAAGDVDLLVGTNVEETRLMLVYTLDQIAEDNVKAALAGFGLPVESTLAAYRDLHPDASAGDLMSAVMTDWGWRLPAMRLADAHASGATEGGTHAYEFAWRSSQFGGRLGAAHSVEMPFVFDTLGNETELIIGADPPQSLANHMHRAWVAFAQTGDPGWPAYDLNRRSTMHFDLASQTLQDPMAGTRALWNGIR